MSYTEVKVRELFNDDIPTNLQALIALLSYVLASIPEEYREAASVDCGPSYEYGEAYGNIIVSYSRPKTEEEISAEEAKERHRQAFRLRQLEREAATIRERLEGRS